MHFPDFWRKFVSFFSACVLLCKKKKKKWIFPFVIWKVIPLTSNVTYKFQLSGQSRECVCPHCCQKDLQISQPESKLLQWRLFLNDVQICACLCSSFPRAGIKKWGKCIPIEWGSVICIVHSAGVLLPWLCMFRSFFGITKYNALFSFWLMCIAKQTKDNSFCCSFWLINTPEKALSNQFLWSEERKDFRYGAEFTFFSFSHQLQL